MRIALCASLAAGILLSGCGNEKKEEKASANAPKTPTGDLASEDKPPEPNPKIAASDNKPAELEKPQDPPKVEEPPPPPPTDEGIQRLSFSKKSIPKEISYKGDVMGGLHFADKNGDNWVIISRTETRPVEDDPLWISRVLQIRHSAIGSDGAVRELRVVRGRVNECFVRADLEVDVKKMSLTDLDADGIAEVTFGYRQACVPDGVEAIDYGYKLLTLENGGKYIIRGSFRQSSETKVVLSKEVDQSVKEAPEAFRRHMEAQWKALAVHAFDRARYSDEFTPQ